MTPEEANTEIEKLLLMTVLGEKALGKIFFETLAYVQIERRLKEMKEIANQSK